MARRTDRSAWTARDWFRFIGLSGAAAGAIAFPFVRDTVQKTMPDGLGAYVRSIDWPAPSLSREVRELGVAPQASVSEPATLEDIVAKNPAVPMSNETGYKLATGLLALGSESLDAYESVSNEQLFEPELLMAISIIESDGGRLPVPRAYLDDVEGGQNATSAPDHVPFGHHHVKLESLVGVPNEPNRRGILEQAEEAREFYSGLGEGVLESIEQLGWSASLYVEDVLSAEQLENALEYFGGESGMRRMAGLAVTIPEDVTITDLNDPAQSALAATIADAYTINHLLSKDKPVDDRARLLAYTGGPIDTARVLGTDHASRSDEEFDAYAREVSGDWAQWYVNAGREVLGLARVHGIETLYETARQLDAYHSEVGGFESDTLGALYLGEIERSGHIDAFERFRETMTDVTDPDEAYETFVSLGSPAHMYANER